MPATEWQSVRREMYAAVSAAKAADRIDAFNRTYGLLRGLAAGFTAATVLTLASAPSRWLVALGLALGAGLALYRMRRFSDHYARELVVEYLRTSERGIQRDPSSATLDASAVGEAQLKSSRPASPLLTHRRRRLYGRGERLRAPAAHARHRACATVARSYRYFHRRLLGERLRESRRRYRGAGRWSGSFCQGFRRTPCPGPAVPVWDFEPTLVLHPGAPTSASPSA